MTRRMATDDKPLASTFVAVIEPYEAQSNIAQIRRLAVAKPDGTPLGDSSAALEIQRKDGRRDLCLVPDQEVASEALEPSNAFQIAGALGLVTVGANGPERVVLCQGTQLRFGPLALKTKQSVDLIEIAIEGGRAKVVSGDPQNIENLTLEGKALPLT
jgi:hypothetical protein